MITIYWGINTRVIPEGLRVDPPVPIIKKIIKDRVTEDIAHEINYHRCPAFADALTNVYGMKSVYDYGIQIENDEIATNTPNKTSMEVKQNFFQQHVTVRSIKGRLFSFAQDMVFFTETPSLIMSQLPPFMEDNNIMKNTIIIPGQFDIGKYFRTLDFAWHFREGCNTIEFNRKEIAFYLRFHTKEKIKFQRFLFTPELSDYHQMIIGSRNNKSPELLSKALNFYYNIFDKYNFKNKILKIIKENLCKKEDLEGNVITKEVK